MILYKLCHWLLYMDDSCFLLSEVNCFHGLWKEATLQSFNIFFASKRHYVLLKISFSCFFILLLVVLLLLHLFKSSLNYTSVLH